MIAGNGLGGRMGLVRYRVDVRQIEGPLQVEDGQTILDAAFAAGHDFPCGCQSGNCGACKAVLLEGKVELDPYSECALTDEERAAGRILACRAMPTEDCRIAWLAADELPAHPQRRLTTRVEALEPLTHDIRLLCLRIEQGGPFFFSAGQYARLGFEGLPDRDFSMASQPGAELLEFHLRVVPGGSVAALIGKSLLAVGDRVAVSGPHGISFLREAHRGPILALAGGSGLAPILCIVERALSLGLTQPMHLYLGVRDEPDVYLEDRLETLAARHPNLKIAIVLSQPTGPTRRRTGPLAQVLAEDFTALDGARAYLAGPPAMVETCMAALRRLGLDAEHCHADAFFTALDRPGSVEVRP